MGVFGPLLPQTAANDTTVGTVAISSPANALLSDNSYASSVLLLSQVSQYLKVTNFGFNIPLDATVTGILVEVEKSASVNLALVDNSVKIVKAGVISGSEKADGATGWSSSDTLASYGSSTDAWGLSWTPADINSSTFGVAISAIANVAATVKIDTVRITVYYTGSNRASASGYMGSLKVGNGMSRNDFN